MMIVNYSPTLLESILEPSAIEVAKNNLLVFTEALGYENAPFHVEWYNFLQNRFSPLKIHPQAEKKYLQLWPRGHGKTEGTSINYPSWLFGNWRDIHINVVSKTASLAESINMAVMERIEHNDKYIAIMGNLKPKNPTKWTTQQFIVDRKEISKNPTMKATGLMGPITGGRSDLVIMDDIIDEENIRTRLQLEKVSTWVWKVLYPTLYPWGGIIGIGTRWSYADIYAELLEKWPSDIKQAVNYKDPEKPETAFALWPEYWSLDKLDERKDEIGTIFFNCQYQNDPTSMEGDLLKSEWLHPWEQQPFSTCEYYAGLDPSLGEGDYFGIATLAYDREHSQAYLVDVWAEHMPFPDIMKHKVPQLHSHYRYSKMFMETNFWQKILTYLPELKGLPIVPVQTVRNKEARFIPMSSHFESKRVLVNPLLLRRSEFWTEWVQFPRSQHDDALDCVEIVIRNVLSQPEPAWVVR